MVAERTFQDFQRLMKNLYYEKDAKRGIDKTFTWFIEEVGELAKAIRNSGNSSNLSEEFADVFAWLISLANLFNIDLLAAAYKKYPMICPRCKKESCICVESCIEPENKG
jgi:NTP pyrophosphatase (non-canonical NTP hydrolase)